MSRLAWLVLLVLALAIVACGPEARRARDVGTGGSSRPAAQPTRTSAPELVVQPTANTPYAVEGPLPTLRPVAPAGTPGGTPAGSPAASPGFAVPTQSPGSTFPIITPGANATPTR